MSGTTELFTSSILLISIVGALTDLLRGKIFNCLTLPALIAGLIYSAYLAGWNGLLGGVLGALLALAAYGWMFFLGAMGGGDVKLLMVFGAWGGPRFVLQIALLGIVLGGVFAVLLLLAKGRFADFARKMQRFLLSLFIKELEVEVPAIDRKLTMPFGVPIAVAAAWVTLANPFERWGFLLWR